MTVRKVLLIFWSERVRPAVYPLLIWVNLAFEDAQGVHNLYTTRAPQRSLANRVNVTHARIGLKRLCHLGTGGTG